MSKRYISIPAVDKRVGLGRYIQGVKMAIHNPDAEFKHGLTCWWPVTGKEIRRQFLQSVHDRINQGIPTLKRGC